MPSLYNTFDRRVQAEIWDDFTHVHDQWALVNDGGTGTNTLDATNGGTYSIVTAGADNDYHYLVADAKCVGLSAGKCAHLSARIKLTEANTDDANIVFGLSSDFAATLITNDGAGPPANYSGALFFKVDGGTVWQAESSVGTAQTTATSVGAFSSGTWTELDIFIGATSSSDTQFDVKFMINGVLVASQKVAVASFAAAGPVLAVKAGGANAETLIVDYILCRWDR